MLIYVVHASNSSRSDAHIITETQHNVHITSHINMRRHTKRLLCFNNNNNNVNA